MAFSAASSSSKPQASTSALSTFYNGSFLPASMGNGIACYSSAAPGEAGDSKSNSAGRKSSSNKGKGKTTSKGKASAADDGDIKFVEFESLKRSRRAFTTETYTVYASLQIIANKFQQDALGDSHQQHQDQFALALRNDGIPDPEQVSYYSRFAQLYRDSINRYLLELSSKSEIDTEELAVVSAIRDVFHLAHIVYVPSDGRGDGIAAEEIVDWLNTTSSYPSAERREELVGMAAPYDHEDFWTFICSSVLRGHLELASNVLETLLNYPSSILQRVTQSCLDLLGDLPRSNSPIYAYETAFLSAVRSWRARVSTALARLNVDMDGFQEEMEEQDDVDADDIAEERLGWQAGFSLLLKILSGDAASIADTAEDGWKSALAAWCLLVRPGLKRDDLPETLDTILETHPADQTVFKETISIALLTGDIPKVLRLAAEEDSWLVTHLSDIFGKLGLLRDATPVHGVTLRDWFLLSYTDILMSDSGLWRVTVDYLASLDNLQLGQGRIREYLLSIGSTSPIEALSGDDGAAKKEEDADGDGDAEGDEMAVVDKVKKETSKKGSTSVEDVLMACSMYGVEDAARSICLMTTESLIAHKKYGLAISYCIRANDARRINKICDLILDEYVLNGEAALALIDSIPTSLLRPSTNGTDYSSANAFRPDSAMFSDNGEGGMSALQQNALALVSGTRLGFLARYRDFHALYASGERRAAAELLTLLMSSNAAPKRFWAVMLLDAVGLLNDADDDGGDGGALVSEQDTYELMRCLNELVSPVENSGRRDIYGHLAYLIRATTVREGAENDQEKGSKTGKGKKEQQGSQSKADTEVERVNAALRQLEVVRYSLVQNLARCFMR